jgi:hypothetical protein
MARADMLRGRPALIMRERGAALGSLLDDADSELDVMREQLTDWWSKKADEFHALGVA